MEEWLWEGVCCGVWKMGGGMDGGGGGGGGGSVFGVVSGGKYFRSLFNYSICLGF